MVEARVRILLVDDDDEDYVITADVIDAIPGGNYQVTWADSYATALDMIAAQEFDLLLFDYRLGPETGIDLLKEVKARKYPAPVILLTGQQDEEIDIEAIRLGAADYMIKGKITPSTFERAVRHAIEQQRALLELQEAREFLQGIIDALTSEIAILDPSGVILAVNSAWRFSFGLPDAYSKATRPGENYLSMSDELPGECREEAKQLVIAIRHVLAREEDRLQLEYPCMMKGMRRWSIARISALQLKGQRHAVVAFEDITKRKLAELELEKHRALLEDLSIRDELTGLYNRRYFNIVLKAEEERSRRYSSAFALLILDIDRFKSINDTYGHQAGDEALKHVARICSQSCRTTDCVARYGGEEIAFILPQTPIPEAFGLAERVREKIASVPVTINSDSGSPKTIKLTASVGVASYPLDSDTISGLIDFADKGLYEAKSTGRNKSVHYTNGNLSRPG